MSDEVEQLGNLVKGKDENGITTFVLNHSNNQLVKLRADYQTKNGKDLLKDLESNFKDDFKNVLVALFKDPVEYDADLLYNAMKGIGSDKNVITEVLCFRTPERMNEVKAKFKEKYGKDLVPEIKSETSGDYQKIALALLEGNRGTNSSPDLENCKKIAKELYDAGEGKLGTNEEVFIKYFTTLSPEELLLVCKEYHKNHKKNMLDSIDNEFDGNVKNLLKIILYALYSPSEYFAIQIHNSVVGYGTADDQLIRSIVSRADIDMKKIKKYYKKIHNKDMIQEVNDDLSGAYKTIIEGLMKK